MSKPKARIENWYVGANDSLYGTVFGHPKLADGEMIVTSRLVKFDPESKKALTMNTEYELGNPALKLKEH